MEQVFKLREGVSYELIPEGTEYCYISMLNQPKVVRKVLPDKVFNFYKYLVKTNNTDMVKNQDPEILSKYCDKNGLRLMDHAIIDGNYDFVKFLYEKCDANINEIPFMLKMSAISFVLTEIDPACDEKLVEHAKIIGYLIREDAFAFSLADYTYEWNNAQGNVNYALEEITYNMRYSTIDKIRVYLDKCINSLGKNIDLDEKLTTAIDIYARMGFMPSVKTTSTQNFKKYNLDYVFDLKERGIKLSQKLAKVMERYCDVINDLYTDYLKATIENANCYAGTYIEESQIDAKTKQYVDYSNSKDFFMSQSQSLGYIDDIDFKDEDLQEDCLDNFQIDSGGVSQSDFDDEDIEDKLSGIANEETDNYELLDEDDLEAIEEQDGFDFEEFEQEIEVIPKYELHELEQIALKNEAYLNECSVLKLLYKTPRRFEDFCNEVESAKAFYKALQDNLEQMKYVAKNQSYRLPDSVDDHLYDLAVEYQDEDKEEREM